MGLLARLKGQKAPNEMGAAMASGAANAELNRPQSSEDALREAYGVNLLLLADEQPLRVVEALAFPKGENGAFMPANPKFAALLVQCSYLPRASFLDKYDAEIGICQARINCRHITMQMSEDELEGGGGIFVQSVLNAIITPNYLSGIEGRLAKLTKVSPKSMEVTYREDHSKKKEGFTP